MKANKVFSRIVSIIGLLFMVACNDGSSAVSQAQGTSDGGGGVVSRSTEAEIRAAVDFGIELLDNKEFVLSIAYGGDEYSKLSEEDQKAYSDAHLVLMGPSYMGSILILPMLLNADPDDENYELNFEAMDQIKNKYSSDLIKDYIAMSTITFKEEGPCPSADKDNADASVSYYDLGAEICFSLENLKRIPKESLQRHVTGLLTHEVLHLFGFNEAVASATQSSVVENFDLSIAGTTINIPYKVYGLFISIKSSLKNIEFMQQGDLMFFQVTDNPEQSQIRNIIYLLGNISGQIEAIEEMMDEEGHFTKAFYLPETKELEKQVLEDNRVLYKWLSNSLEYSDDVLLSDVFLQELLEVQIHFDKTLDSYSEIVDAYQRK